MKLTAINTGNGKITVHKTGCGDVNKTIKRHPSASVWSFEADSEHGALRAVNADFVADWDAEGTSVEDGDGGTTKFLACTNGLPASDPDADAPAAVSETEPVPVPEPAAPAADVTPEPASDPAPATGTGQRFAAVVDLLGAGEQQLSFAKNDGAVLRSFASVAEAYDFALTRKTGYVQHNGSWLRRGGRFVRLAVVDVKLDATVTVAVFKVEPPHSNNTPVASPNADAHDVVTKLVVDALAVA